jgi:hypothetical protein
LAGNEDEKERELPSLRIKRALRIDENTGGADRNYRREFGNQCISGTRSYFLVRIRKTPARLFQFLQKEMEKLSILTSPSAF